MQAVAALKAAAQAGDLAAAEALIASHPEAARDWRPILEAALYGEPAIVGALLAAGADPNAQSTAESHYRPLHRAIEPKVSIRRKAGHLEVLHRLIDAGADVDGLGGWYDGRPLQTAARDGMADCAEILVARGAKRDIFAAVLIGDRALFDAELRGDPAKATSRAESGAEPLHHLVFSRLAQPVAVSMAEQLTAAGARSDRVAKLRHGDFSVLSLAAFRGDCDPALIELVIDHGADPQDGVYESLWQGDFSTTALVVGRGADVNKPWKPSGRPMLSEMIQWGRNPAALWLLDAGADPSRTDAKGWTALHYAASRGAPDGVIARLLASGADAGARNTEGLTAAEVGRAAGKTKAVAALA
jgi:ankyrin repeat protein